MLSLACLSRIAERVLCPEQCPVNPLRSLLLHARPNVRVRVERDRDISVSQPLRDDFNVHPLFQQQRRVRVASVTACGREVGSGEDQPEQATKAKETRASRMTTGRPRAKYLAFSFV